LDRIAQALTPQTLRWGTCDESVTNTATVLDLTNEKPGEESNTDIRIKLGRGGMFVPFTGAPPTSGTVIRFKVPLGDGAGPPSWVLVGAGTVKWSRSEDAENLRRGCGIEFTYIEEGCRDQLMRRISESGVSAYIPNR
jgi:hypothetical protein